MLGEWTRTAITTDELTKRKLMVVTIHLVAGSVLNRPVRPRFLQDGRTAPRPSVSVLTQDGRNDGRHPPSSGGYCISLD